MSMITTDRTDQHLDENGLRSVGRVGPLWTPTGGRWRTAALRGDSPIDAPTDNLKEHEHGADERRFRQSGLTARALELLQTSPYQGLRAVTCDACPRFLVLRGRVRSYHLKQLAQERVRDLCGTRKIVNLLEVVPAEEPRVAAHAR